jgi:putative SOS response-associated peptidase YedK
MVNGFEEATIPIVTMEEPSVITPAIWGILPEGYKENWQDFQNFCNTLNVPLHSINKDLWYSKSLLNRRCLIPVTGFFTTYVKNGIIYPFFFSNSNNMPICLAGIYTKTNDGFLTCSIITCEADEVIGQVHNVDSTMPVILSKEKHSLWLSEETEMENIMNILNTAHDHNLKSHPIAREFYTNNISYNSMLEPVFYEAIPTGI